MNTRDHEFDDEDHAKWLAGKAKVSDLTDEELDDYDSADEECSQLITVRMIAEIRRHRAARFALTEDERHAIALAKSTVRGLGWNDESEIAKVCRALVDIAARLP